MGVRSTHHPGSVHTGLGHEEAFDFPRFHQKPMQPERLPHAAQVDEAVRAGQVTTVAGAEPSVRGKRSPGYPAVIEVALHNVLAPELQFAGLSHTTQLSRDLRLTVYSGTVVGTVVSLIVGPVVGPVVGSVLAPRPPRQPQRRGPLPRGRRARLLI